MLSTIFLFIFIVLFLYIFVYFFVLNSESFFKDDYNSFYNFLIDKAKNESIPIKINDGNLKDNKCSKYLYRIKRDNKFNIQYEPILIEWSVYDFLHRKKTMFSLMSLAHEIGHHYALKNENSTSEIKADIYAIKLFVTHFSYSKCFIHFPMIYFFLYYISVMYVHHKLKYFVFKKY